MLKYKLKKLSRKKAIVWTTILLLFAVSMFSIVRYYASYSDAVSTLNAPNSGISGDGNTVIINDLESDWNYYLGLNYTQITSKSDLPTYEARYGESNLVAVKVVYDGTDINHPDDVNYRGKVSNISGEGQYKFEYYKYYPAYGTGSNRYVEIELIDNPFTVRPSGLGFNGWVCNGDKYDDNVGLCDNSVISYDDTYYTRYIKVVVGSSSTATLYLNASWATADVRTSNPENFSSKTMKHIEKTDHNIYLNYERYEIVGNRYYFLTGTTYLNATPTEVTRNTNMINNSGGSQIVYQTRANNGANWSTTYTIASSGYSCPANYCRYYDVIAVTSGMQATNPTNYAILENGQFTRINDININSYFNVEAIYEWVTKDPVYIGVQTDPLSIVNASGYYYLTSAGSDGYYNSTGGTTGSRTYKLIQFNDSFRDAGSTDYVDANVSQYNNFSGGEAQEGQTRLISCNRDSSTGTTVDCKINNAGFADKMNSYYYLVTRDINIYRSNTYAVNKPMTIEDARYNDDEVSNDLAIVGTGTNSNSASLYNDIEVGYHNFKIGRNVNTGSNSRTIIGSSGTTSGKMKIIVESGVYGDLLSKGSGAQTSTEAKFVYGSDYDRARSWNDKLEVRNSVSANKAGGNATNTGIIPSSAITIKSGVYGTSAGTTGLYNSNGTQGKQTGYNGEANTDYYTKGIYVGSWSTSSTNTALRTLTVEGGIILNINGGPCVSSSINGNAIAIYVKGGTITSLFGGAGKTETYGNRIISVTGGNVTNSIAGGSNGNVNTGGAMSGNTLVYVGGNAIIGYDSQNTSVYGQWASSTFYEVNTYKGSVFGAGLGQSTSTSGDGRVNNSHVIINGGTIHGSVFGGGNFGSVGTGSNTASEATIDLFGGTIEGSVFGASNSAGGGYNNNTGSSNNSILLNDYYVIDNATSTESLVETQSATCRNSYNYQCNVNNDSNWNTATTSSENNNNYGNIPAGSYLMNGTYISSATQCNSSNADQITGPSTSNWSAWVRSGGNGSYVRRRTRTTTTTYSCSYYKKVNSGSNYSSSTTYYELIDGNFVQVTPEYESESSNGYVHTITINLDGATINNSIYGGSNASGNVYGNVFINLYSGTVNTNTNSIKSGVYGGGYGVSTNVYGNTTIKSNTSDNTKLLINDVYGGSSQGTVNDYGKTNITINGGTFNNIYGGGHGINSNEPSSLGNVTVNISNGIINDAFNGNNVLGKPTGTMNIKVSGGEINRVFGGSNGSGAKADTTHVLISGGMVGNVFGGGNMAPTSTGTNVSITGGTIGYSDLGNIVYGNVYGGGNEATVGENNTNNGYTHVSISGGIMGSAFGGGNKGAVAGDTDVLIEGGTYKNIQGGVFGGGNEASIKNSIVNVKGGSFEGSCTNGSASVFGGGNNVTTGSGAAESTTVNVVSGATLNNVYGGSNIAGSVSETHVNASGGTINCNLYGGGYNAFTSTTNVNITGTSFTGIAASDVANAPFGNAFGGGQSASVDNSNITLDGATLNNVYGGSNQVGVVASSNVAINSGTVTNVFGGNNAGGATSNSLVTIDGNATIKDVFGGSNGKGAVIGNYKNSTTTAYVFNAADIEYLSSGSTRVDIKSGTINGSVYGGGNQAVVFGDATVNLYGGTVKENIFGGGNEAHIGSELTGFTVTNSNDPNANQNTGLFDESSPNSNKKITVNIVNGTVEGNVFGSGNIAFVHGNTYVNIGNKALSELSLSSNSSYSISIQGNIFGGSYSIANEDDSYSYDSIGVGGSTNVNIDSNGYYTGTVSRIDFEKAIYGEGNNSSVTKNANVIINNFGTKETTAILSLVARATDVRIKDSFILIKGDRDKAQYIDKKQYSFVTIKNLYLLGSSGTSSTGTTLYLAGGGKELDNYYSGYFDSENNFVKQSLSSSKEPVGSDNRIYMQKRKVLYVSTGEVYRSDPGYVNGITFLGIFSNADGIKTGIYNPDVYSTLTNGVVSEQVYGEINPMTDFTYVYGSSYLKGEGGVQSNNRINIEVDGFYSNYADPDTRELTTDYVGVTPEGKEYYEWVVGNRTLEIDVYLEASKYSMNSYQDVSIRKDEMAGWKDAVIELQDINPVTHNLNLTSGFGGGNILNSTTTWETELVPRTEIPVINNNTDPVTNVTDANRIFGLRMGTTTDGWLGNYNTDIIGGSGVGDELIGDKEYYFDSTDGYRDLSFWLYSSKNIDMSYIVDPNGTDDSNGIDLGVVVVGAYARQLNALDGNDASLELSINIHISLVDGDKDGYGFNIAPGKKYNTFSSRPTTINTTGAFSIYQSLSIDLNNQVSTSDTRTWKNLIYGTDTSYHRVLKSGVKLPVGARITMLDLITNEQYFYVVTGSETTDSGNNYIYSLDNFVSMSNVSGSIKNYSDDTGNILTGVQSTDNANRKYYNSFTSNGETTELQTEEFIFTVDFSSVASNVMPSSIDSYLYMELIDRNSSYNPNISLATGNPTQAMSYKVVSANNISIQTEGGFLSNPSNTNSVVNPETSFNIYRQTPVNLYLNTRVHNGGSNDNFTNTIFDDYKLGVNITFKKVDDDGNGNITTTQLGYNVLEGLVVTVNGEDYSPETDGTIRMLLARRVSTVSSNLIFDFSKISESEFEFGKYQVCVDPFGSYDGLYAENGHDNSAEKCFNFELLNDNFGIDVTTEPVMITHDILTGEDSEGNKTITYKVKEVNGLGNPRLRISLSRLNDHDSNDYSDISYTQKDLCDFVTTINAQGITTDCSTASKITVGNTIYYDLRPIAKNVQTTYNVVMTLKTPTTSDISDPDNSKWRSGTYKVTFSIVDGDGSSATVIGDDYEYLIIRKLDVEELIADSGSGG